MGGAPSQSEEPWLDFNRDVRPLLLSVAAVDGRQVWARVGGLAFLQQVLGPNENGACASSNSFLGTAAWLLLSSDYFL